MKTECSYCAGRLTLVGRFCQTLWLRCAICRAQFTQVAPREFVEALAGGQEWTH